MYWGAQMTFLSFVVCSSSKGSSMPRGCISQGRFDHIWPGSLDLHFHFSRQWRQKRILLQWAEKKGKESRWVTSSILGVRCWTSKMASGGTIISAWYLFVSHCRFHTSSSVTCLPTHMYLMLWQRHYWHPFTFPPGGAVYWEVKESSSFYNHWASSANIETNSYILLAFLSKPGLTSEELSYSSQIVQWVAKQQNSRGGFSSTKVTYIYF